MSNTITATITATMNTSPISNAKHDEIDEAKAKLQGKCEGQQFVRGFRMGDEFHVVRFTKVRTQRDPRRLEWLVINLNN